MKSPKSDPDGNSRKPTQKDIAKLAGVSQALVSLALSESSAPVAKEARQRVLDAAEKLGYTSRSRRKKSHHRKLLAYIRPSVERWDHADRDLFDSYDHFYDRIQNLLVEKAYASGYEMIVRPYTRPVEVTQWLIEWGVEGVFWHSSDETLAGWIVDRYPTVQINRQLRIAADAVLPNQEEIVLQAIHHLRQNGHDRIALLSQARTDTVALQRNQTYLAYTREHGLSCYEEWMTQNDLEEIVRWLGGGSSSKPTALILGDFQALHIQKQLRKAGFSLPNDLSMVGIDNISASEFASPPLTSVDIQMEEIINAALSIMTSRINGTVGAIQKIEVNPRLVLRESVYRLEEAGRAVG